MYNVAILGCGRHGRGHNWAKAPDCRVVAVCDLDEQRARERAETYGVPFYVDADEMFEKEKIDIVDAPVREQNRFEVVMKCLKYGKHIYTEKPLGGEEGQMKIKLTDLPKARAMIDEWQKSGVQLGVCFCLHGTDNIRWMKEQIRTGEYGEPVAVSARAFSGTWPHLVEMFRYLGGEVDEVFGHADEAWRSRSATVRFANGAVGNLMTSAPMALQYQIKWIGQQGELQVDDITGVARGRLKSGEERALPEGSAWGAMLSQHIADFVASIKERRRFVADGWAGLRQMELDAAISESIMTGRPVKVERYKPEQGRTVFSE
ncbi:MAG: Gfo/Idh/MocA family oxidoreductase [Armatimonadetes bacterium]|nr:Gfo/Idh/MocA family oxidoreductase [Armatimonadota bacterium]